MVLNSKAYLMISNLQGKNVKHYSAKVPTEWVARFIGLEVCVPHSWGVRTVGWVSRLHGSWGRGGGRGNG